MYGFGHAGHPKPTHFAREEVRRMLSRDMLYRRVKSWPLVPHQHFHLYKAEGVNVGDERAVHTVQASGHQQNLYKLGGGIGIEGLCREYKCIQTLLDRHSGKLVIAGGAIITSLTSPDTVPKDVDFFFHSCSVETAASIMRDCIRIIVASSNDAVRSLRVDRQRYVTNVSVYYSDVRKQLQYQFIHRVYPSSDTIVGGFDLGPCAALYDGVQVLATPMGAYSLANMVLILDLSRRSTSFAFRVHKYHQKRRCSVVIPGIAVKPEPLSIDRKEAVAEAIREVLLNEGLRLEIPRPEWEYRPRPLSSYIRQRYYQDIGKELRIFPYKVSNPWLSHMTQSDYGLVLTHDIPSANGTALRAGNLESVRCVVGEWRDRVDAATVLERYDQSMQNPVVAYDDYLTKAKRWTTFVFHPNNDGPQWPLSKKMAYQLFGRDGYEVRRYLCTGKRCEKGMTDDKLNSIVQHMKEKMDRNRLLAIEELKRVQWITHDPGRQWTSSINPVITDVREYYGDSYVPFRVGLDPDVELAIRLGRLSPASPFSRLPLDCLTLVIQYVIFLQ